MRIANPIYDAVFKFLMEDTEIARLFLGRIIGEEIVEIQVQPQEHARKSSAYLVVIFRLDFRAIIRTQSGEMKKVLIELQKGSFRPLDPHEKPVSKQDLCRYLGISRTTLYRRLCQLGLRTQGHFVSAEEAR